mmetsp:Transcript_23064/g.46667  ORF Transcript_23064/g.46667 Transcript_23064/m.46667 type:complete len:101 (+) Transcript_23064:1178-1480(+)
MVDWFLARNVCALAKKRLAGGQVFRSVSIVKCQEAGGAVSRLMLTLSVICTDSAREWECCGLFYSVHAGCNGAGCNGELGWVQPGGKGNKKSLENIFPAT